MWDGLIEVSFFACVNISSPFSAFVPFVEKDTAVSCICARYRERNGILGARSPESGPANDRRSTTSISGSQFVCRSHQSKSVFPSASIPRITYHRPVGQATHHLFLSSHLITSQGSLATITKHTPSDAQSFFPHIPHETTCFVPSMRAHYHENFKVSNKYCDYYHYCN